MSYVIGIDPSITATGVCVLYDNRQPRLYTCKAPDTSTSLGSRLYRLQVVVATAALPTGSAPLLAGIESPISPIAAGKAGSGAGFNNNLMAYGVLYEMLGKFRVPYVEVAPKQRAMIATGNGNAKKDQVVNAFNGLMIPHECIKLDNNQVDAFYIAMAAAEVYALSDKQKTKPFKPFTGWLDLEDKCYDMIETLEIQLP